MAVADAVPADPSRALVLLDQALELRAPLIEHHVARSRRTTRMSRCARSFADSMPSREPRRSRPDWAWPRPPLGDDGAIGGGLYSSVSRDLAVVG